MLLNQVQLFNIVGGNTIGYFYFAVQAPELIELVGLQATLRVEVSGQAESLEQSGVEEVVVADDAAIGDLDDLNRPR